MDSQAIINTMEVLETRPVSSLAAEATIKVCYVSDKPNRNGTVINEEIGREIAATLPGAPIVGFYSQADGDFVEHSRRLTIDHEGIKFEDLTKPYGFVSPIHSPWYQKFKEDGEERKYLMCKGYLWTRQYEEAKQIKEKGQSMELNSEQMSGYYDGDVFVFTHAVLDRLCVLGDKHEPCFEGANIVANYSLGYNSLAKEIEDIIGKRYYVLDDKLVEKEMLGDPESVMPEDLLKQGIEPNDPVPAAEPANEPAVEPVVEPVANNVDPAPVEPSEPVADPAAEPVAEPVAEPTNEPTPEPEPTAEPVVEPTTEPVADPVDPVEPTAPAEPVAEPATEPTAEPTAEPVAEPSAEPAGEYAELTSRVTYLEQQLAERDARISELEQTVNTYKAAEAKQLETEKQGIVESYKLLLTDEEMKPVVDSIAEYSLEDVESKLAVIFARKTREQQAASAATNYQLDVNHLPGKIEEDVPEFMKQAMAYDQAHGLTNLKI